MIPAYRRYDVTRVSFPGLRWALDQLSQHYAIDGHAVVIGDDENLEIAEAHGFHMLRAPNQPLGRKWNNGYEYACDNGADYVVPCGTDDWLDPAYLAQLPGERDVRASRRSTTIREDGRELAYITVGYHGGDGIRIIPTSLLAGCGNRPANDRKERAIDTSVWMTLNRTAPGYEFVYNRDPLAIVQFQSYTPQLNSYRALVDSFAGERHEDVWGILASRYPRPLVDAAKMLYRGRA